MSLPALSRRTPRQTGVTILEFIAFIGLAALVIAGALMLYNAANAGAKAKDFTVATTAIALAAKQAATDGGPNAVTAALISAPSGWLRSGSGWGYANATLAFTNNNDGTFTLKLSGVSNADVAKQLVGKAVFGVVGVANGSAGVDWAAISFK